MGIIFLGGLAGGYFYFSKISPKEKYLPESKIVTLPNPEDLFTLKIYYPLDNQLQIEERILQKRAAQRAIAEAIVEEFLKGPAGMRISNIPKNTKLLGIYRDENRILYIDLSDEFRRNFHGDSLSEFLLIKGLYESLITNLDEIEDVKVLIEGREVETLGGHLYLSSPLKDIVSYETRLLPDETKIEKNE